MKLLLVQLACLFALGATAWAAGWLAWGRRRPEATLHPFPACLGLALLGQAGLLLAAAGELRPPVLLAAAVALHLAAAAGWRRAFLALRDAVRGNPRGSLVWSAVAVLALAPGLAIGLYPPHAFDETTYHLPFARALAETGDLPYLPHLRTPVFPLLAETLQSMVLLAAGDTATHVVSLLATLLAAALLLAWGREAHGREAHGREAGWLAAALLLGSPLVAYLAGTGYVEPLLAMCTTAALYAASRPPGHVGGRPVAAGVLAGSAAAVKYLGLPVIAVAAAALLARRSRAWTLVAFALAAAACALPTYGWLHLQTGSPLHPFFPELFGPSLWSSTSPAAGVAERARALATLPADAVWNRAAVGAQPPLSPAYLLGLPLVAVAAWRSPALRPPLAMLALGLAGFLVVPANARYLVQWLPLWSLVLGAAAAWAWSALAARRSGPPSTAAAALLALGLLLPGTLYAVFYASRVGTVPASARARRDFLAAQVPGYAAVAWLGENGPAGAVVYALHGEQLHGIAPQAILGEHTGPLAHARVAAVLADPPRLAARLRAFGASHLLLLTPHAGVRLDGPKSGLRRIYTDDESAIWEVGPAPAGPARGALLRSAACAPGRALPCPPPPSSSPRSR